MGIWNFLFGRKNEMGMEAGAHPAVDAPVAPNIPRDIFVEDEGLERPNDEPNGHAGRFDIDWVYEFMLSDLEPQGYQDALSNPDDSYRQDKARLIGLEAQIRIDRALLYYSQRIEEIDFHIQSRSRVGLNDLAEELGHQKRSDMERVEILRGLKREAGSQEGASARAVLSYQAGFKRGLAAITHANLLSRSV